jgi:hypothetical protein
MSEPRAQPSEKCSTYGGRSKRPDGRTPFRADVGSLDHMITAWAADRHADEAAPAAESHQSHVHHMAHWFA